MNLDDAKKIIKDEGLQGYNINENREHDPDEIVIKKKGDMWEVYNTSEKAGILFNTLREFSTEDEAVEIFINRLRADKEIRGERKSSLK